MKKLLCVCLVSLSLLFSNRLYAKPDSSIAGSERIFAETARLQGIKSAFQKYMSPKGYIVVGNTITNALSYYERIPNDTTDLLWWRPVMAFINKENDFGFATGPFRYFRKKNGVATGSGYTFSIWEKNSDGLFKILFDGGVNSGHIPDSVIASAGDHTVSEFNFGSESILTVENPPSIEHFSEDRIHRRAIFLRPNSSGILSYQQAKVAPKLFKTVIGEGFDRMRKTYYRFGNLSKDRQSTQDRKYCGYFAQVWSLDRSGWMLLADVMQF
ncbi:hypothetical protein ABTW24_24260 [Sphingobacterium thalpophilum]|uniref:Uncharacterized protein n=1 Tax=Sphingobacterium thalpophilum TaxID=259 RepID=A0ABV4HJL9_9SPHI